MCSWAWKRIAVSSSLAFSISGSVSVRTAIRWLATPSRTFARELVLGEELLERVRERLRVGDLALAKDAGIERGDPVAADRGRCR